MGGLDQCCNDCTVVSLVVTVIALSVFSVEPLNLLNLHSMQFSSGTNLQWPLLTLSLQSIVPGGTGIRKVTSLAERVDGNSDFKLIW